MIEATMQTMTLYRGQADGQPLGHWWTPDEACAGEFGDHTVTAEVTCKVATVAHTRGLAELDSRAHDRMLQLFETIMDRTGADALLLATWDYDAPAVYLSHRELRWL